MSKCNELMSSNPNP